MRRRLTFALLIVTTATAFSALGAGASYAAQPSCGQAELSQPFLPWDDAGYYTQLPNGDFEQRSNFWTFGGEAGLVRDNESFSVAGTNDSKALNIGESGSAISDPVCVGLDSPTIRLFARNAGSPLSTLTVSVQFTDILGLSHTVPVGVITAGEDWQPTAPVPVVVNLLGLPVVSDGTTDVSFVFTPVGAGGDWTIDDVYVDPFKTN
jgi:hypothetical protein